MSLKLGWRKRYFPLEDPIEGLFFKHSDVLNDFPTEWKLAALNKADQIMAGTFTLFSFHKYSLGDLPNWFYNPFEEKYHSQPKKHWTEIDDFGEGDIKVVWEFSRFDWLTDLARAYKISGDNQYLSRLNALLNDWSRHNPANSGPNWKCGQEASFRVLKLLTTAELLDQFTKPSSSLLLMIKQHVDRIEPNIRYAISQQNNHSTSEAIALYVGSAYLIEHGFDVLRYRRFKIKGRSYVEKLVPSLILPNGTFSQLSTNYHRVLLDTVSHCLHFIRLLGEPDFNPNVAARLEQAGIWMYQLIAGQNGETPNFGSNDGALIENLHSADYTDYRPSLQLFWGLLKQERIYSSMAVSEPLYWRSDSDISSLRPAQLSKTTSILDDQIVVLRKHDVFVFLKLPGKIFRQGNDVFHIDLWFLGKPILVDTGSYSYNVAEWTDHFKSIEAHNTAQIEQEEPLFKIGRFLNGGWIKPLHSDIEINNATTSWSGTVAYKGFKHSRKVIIKDSGISIIDNVSSEHSVIRYHLLDSSNYDITKGVVKESQAYHSPYYLYKEQIKLLEISPDAGHVAIDFHFQKDHI